MSEEVTQCCTNYNHFALWAVCICQDLFHIRSAVIFSHQPCSFQKNLISLTNQELIHVAIWLNSCFLSLWDNDLLQGQGIWQILGRRRTINWNHVSSKSHKDQFDPECWGESTSVDAAATCEGTDASFLNQSYWNLMRLSTESKQCRIF